MKKAEMVIHQIGLNGWLALTPQHIKKHLIKFWNLDNTGADIISRDWQLWNYFELCMTHLVDSLYIERTLPGMDLKYLAYFSFMRQTAKPKGINLCEDILKWKDRHMYIN